MLFNNENFIPYVFPSTFSHKVTDPIICVVDEEDAQYSNTLKEQRVEQPNNSTTCDIDFGNESDEMDVRTVGSYVVPQFLYDKLINNPNHENWDTELKDAVTRFKIARHLPLDESYDLMIAPGRYITLPALPEYEFIVVNMKRGSTKLGRIDSRFIKRRKMIGQFPPAECQLSLLPKDLLVKLTNKRKHQDWDDDLKNAVKKFKMDNNFPLKRKVRIRIAPGEYIILPRFSEKEKHKTFCQHRKPLTCTHKKPVTCTHKKPVTYTHKKPVTCTHKKPVTCTHKKPLASAQLRSERMVTSWSKQIHMGTSDQETQTDAKESCFEAPQVIVSMEPEASNSEIVVSAPSDVPSTSTVFHSDSEIDDEGFPFPSICDSDSEIDDDVLSSGKFFDSDSEIDVVSLPSNVASTSTSFAKQVRSDAVFVSPASPPWSMPDDLRDRLMQNADYLNWDEELKKTVREFKLKRKFPLEKTVRMRIAPETYITLPGFPEVPQKGVKSAQKAKLKSAMKTDKQLLKMKSKMKHCTCNVKRKDDRR